MPYLKTNFYFQNYRYINTITKQIKLAVWFKFFPLLLGLILFFFCLARLSVSKNYIGPESNRVWINYFLLYKDKFHILSLGIFFDHVNNFFFIATQKKIFFYSDVATYIKLKYTKLKLVNLL